MCDFDDVMVLVGNENTDDVGSEKVHDDSQRKAEDKGDHRTFENAAADAADHAGAEVLCHIGRHCNAERYHRLSCQLFDPHRRSESGNGIGAERVANALRNGGADGNDGKLDGHRYGDFEMLFAELPVEFPVFGFGMKKREFFADVK